MVNNREGDNSFFFGSVLFEVINLSHDLPIKKKDHLKYVLDKAHLEYDSFQNEIYLSSSISTLYDSYLLLCARIDK